MAFTIVQSQISASGVSANPTASLTWSSAPTNGNLLVVALTIRTNATVTENTTQGWIQAIGNITNGTTAQTEIWYRVAGAGEGTTGPAFNIGTAVLYEITQAEVSGFTGTPTLDKTGSQIQTASTTDTVSAASITAASEFCFAGCGNREGATSGVNYNASTAGGSATIGSPEPIQSVNAAKNGEGLRASWATSGGSGTSPSITFNLSATTNNNLTAGIATFQGVAAASPVIGSAPVPYTLLEPPSGRNTVLQAQQWVATHPFPPLQPLATVAVASDLASSVGASNWSAALGVSVALAGTSAHVSTQAAAATVSGAAGPAPASSILLNLPLVQQLFASRPLPPLTTSSAPALSSDPASSAGVSAWSGTLAVAAGPAPTYTSYTLPFRLLGSSNLNLALDQQLFASQPLPPVSTQASTTLVAGSSAGISTWGATASVVVALAGRTATTGILAASSAEAVALAGSLTAVSVAAGSASTATPISGSTASSTTWTGAVTAAVALSGTWPATSTDTSTLTAAVALAGAISAISLEAASASAVSGTPISGSTAAVARWAGSLVSAMALSGSSLSPSAVAATLALAAALNGASTASAQLTGTLTVSGGAILQLLQNLTSRAGDRTLTTRPGTAASTGTSNLTSRAGDATLKVR